ncbi:MAG: hypothetical protein OEV66_00885 [Spirochaetia bacterium]|nr:hypothetical protein [Spirochaetia bacterium]
MAYIILTYDLIEDDYDENRDDLLETFLEDIGFVFDVEGFEVPSTMFIKKYNDGDDIKKIEQSIVQFCDDNELFLFNLVVAGPTEISHYYNIEEGDDEEE